MDKTIMYLLIAQMQHIFEDKYQRRRQKWLKKYPFFLHSNGCFGKELLKSVNAVKAQLFGVKNEVRYGGKALSVKNV